MMSFHDFEKFTLHETQHEREKAYREIYGKIVKNNFALTEKKISRVNRILQSGKALNSSSSERFRVAELLALGVHDTCLAIQTFYESVMEFSEIIGKLSLKSQIKICCLGRKSFPAVLGICKVIDECVMQFGFLDDSKTKIYVFVIDEHASWKDLCKHTVHEANSSYKKVELKLDYLAQDPTKNFSKEVELRIGKSHVVTMARFLSQFAVTRAEAFITKALSIMKKNAVLFFMDDCSQDHYVTLKSHLISLQLSFSEIKSSVERYQPPLESESEQHYSLGFPCTWNTDFQPVVCSAWIKCPDVKVKSASATQVSSSNKSGGSTDPRKETSNKKDHRTTPRKFKLDGKYAYKDLEKRNKDFTHRQEAKRASISRNANFDYDD